MSNIVTRQEQRDMELLPAARSGNFVAPEPVRYPGRLDIAPAHEVRMDVQHPATQEVIVHTSATDRARGFQMIITPISLVVALLAVLVSLAFENEFLSFASLLIFWLTFAVIYVFGWALTATATPEFVSWYSARRQWDVIEREQSERWEHYRWQTGRLEAERHTERQRSNNPDSLDSILDARWLPWALVGLIIYFVVGFAWLIIKVGA